MVLEIDDIAHSRLHLPLDGFRTGHGETNYRRTVVLRVECHIDGLRAVGRGEAPPLEAWGTEAIDDVDAVLENLHAPNSAFSIRELDEAFPQLTEMPATRFAVETACLDAAARARNMPLYELLAGGEIDPRFVPVNGLVDADTTPVRPERFGCLKMKVAAEDIDEALARVARVREELPAGVELRIDANGLWDPDTAQVFLERLEPGGIDYVEQPVPAEERAALVELARRCDIPVAADESAHPIANAFDLLARGVPVLVLKPAALGGLLGARELAAEAARRDTRVVWTSAIESNIGRRAVLHLAATCGDGPHGLATGHLLSEATSRDAPELDSGRLPVPDRPGLGFAAGEEPFEAQCDDNSTTDSLG